MTGVNLAGLLVAALVSALVALGVEWAAKPRLEARKERILSRHRARNEVWRCLDDILLAAGALKMSTQADDDETRAVRDGIVPATRALEAAFRELMPFTKSDVVGVVASYTGFVRGVMASDRSWQDKGALLFTWTPKIMDILGGPGQGPFYRLRWRYRRRQLHDATAFLES
jgi:hypothetical protein